jgi:murein DD-endopeptidase MepM/ murein hydrolase activator NlpD
LKRAVLFLIPLCLGARGEPRITWSPEKPRQGTLFRIEVSGVDDSARIEGSVAGEALHFASGESGKHTALAPIPIDSAGTIAARIVIADETTTVRIPIAAGAYHLEKLRVAPQFGQEPDSALAARLEDERRRAAAVGVGSHESPRFWSAAFLRPRPSRITSTYGSGREFNGRVTSRHLGTDFAGQTGDTIRAANRGVVRLVDRFYLGGNVVYVDHGAGLTTAYLHMSKTLVAVGDTVQRGQAIGRVGATGRVTGPHLHFIVRYGTITVDPMSLLPPPTGR